MLNKALRLIRVFEGMTQVEAASKIGVSQSYLSEIERGTKTPTLEVIGKYSEAFSMPASAIMLFSERLRDGSSAEKARSLVAGKVLNLLEFLAERSDQIDAR
jgi:transcriptional regulator with XRE-family HTH domain